jgi:hypothetical protein
MLPAFAIFTAVALAWAQSKFLMIQPLVARLLQPVVVLLIAINAVMMMYRTPLVLKEAIVNSTTRIALESSIARELSSFPTGASILMYNSDHIGALQRAGIPLRQTISETDYDTWKAALASPATHAAYVVAIAGDPVSEAVKANPQGLTELTIICTSGQPCARVYKTNR